ncbi:MAG: hypothetical protein JKY67_08520 [Pseudomonadales bacterium]|nr:hypothetical protein [Pseudomonadales bacterium]
MKFTELERMVGGVLNDSKHIVWTQDQVRDWLVDAERVTIAARADAGAVTETVQLIPGTRQELPLGGIKLLTVIRNMGSGSVPGVAIRLVDRGIKDESDPNWHTEAASAVIYEYTFDDRIPAAYFVSPPALANTNIQIEYSKEPGPYDFSENPDTTISDIYTPHMIEWALYRCFSRSDENTPDYVRSQAHYQRWGDMLRLKLNSDINVSPKQRGHLL